MSRPFLADYIRAALVHHRSTNNRPISFSATNLYRWELVGILV